jgi:hypothetical protein
MEDTIRDAQGVDWVVWFHVLAMDRGYVNFKVVANGEAKRKANYWIARNKAGGSLSRDLTIMKENNPDLFQDVAACMDRVCEREMGR